MFFVYFVVCFECYVLSLVWAKRYSQHQSWFTLAHYSIPALTALSALGVYLGRVQRLESTDIVNQPLIVLRDSLIDLTHLKSFLVIVLFFIGYLVSFYVFNYLNQLVVDRYRARFEL